MATIATTTNSAPFIYPATTLLDRDPTTGQLYCMVKGSTANTYDLYRSDTGASWGLWSTLTRANVQEIGSLHINNWGHIYWCYRTNESSQDRVYVRRMYPPWSNAWEAEILTGNPANGGVAGAVLTGMDLHTVVYPTTGETFVVVAAGTVLGGLNGVTLYGLYSDVHGTLTYTNNVVPGGRQWLPDSGTGRSSPSVDIEHTGDGKSAGVPHLWVGFGRTTLRLVKLAWTGGGWTGPGSSVLINSGIGADDSIAARWDGQRFVMAIPNPATTNTVVVYERNQANSSTTTRTTPTHPQGVVRNCTVNYDSSSRNIRVFGIGTSTDDLYYVDFVRATATWGSWATVTTTDILGAATGNYGVRRATTGTSKHHVYAAASGAPNTLTEYEQSVAYTPNTPTWSSPVNGTAQDVAASLLLDWNFVDPDSNDTQKDYALSRQVAAGTLEYWRVSDGTWQAGEIKNASTTSALTLTATQWSTDGLANGATDTSHTYKVKVWDSTDLASGYSAATTIIPSAKVNPAIVTPTAAQVLTANSVTITWTATEETAYRVQLTQTSGGSATYDSGKLTGTALTHTPTTVLLDNTGWTASLTTWNNEGLASTVQTRAFTVDYINPMTPTLVTTAVPASGWISVAITNPTPSGGAPALASQDLYRRVSTDSDDGVRLATGLASGATHLDWKARSGISYAYRAMAVGVNGTATYSAWT